MGKIISKKRHESTHRQSIEVEDYATLIWGKFFPRDRIEQIKLANPNFPKTVIHTEEMAYVEVADCQSFIISIINMVSEARKKFPNEFLANNIKL